jgi:outer membrane protein assembly factor BamB
MKALHRGALAAVVVFTLPLFTEAQRPSADWPQWRGPNRDGSAGNFAVPQAWPENLVQRWKTDVGIGYATPLIVGNRIYVFSRRAETETMAALDTETGKEVWHTGYAADFTMNSAAARHGKGPKSTPVFANGTLFSIGMTGIVTAFDAGTGKQLWQKPGSMPLPLYTSHAFSPIVDRGLVIFHVGGHDKGALTAFDVATGTVKWSWPGDGPGYGSPIVADLGGVRQVITITQGKVVGVDISNGALLWERPFPSAQSTNSNTPVLHGQTVIVSGNGGPTVAFTVAKNGTQWTTATAWENPDVPLRLTNIVVAGDLLFGLTNRNAGQYFGVDAKTGKTLWTSPGRQTGNAAIEKAGDFLFSLEDDGDLVVARSSQTGFDQVRKYKVADGETWAEPALSGNRIFVKDLNTVTLWTLN